MFSTKKKTKFPIRLYQLLEDAEDDPVLAQFISWLPEGTCFAVWDSKLFEMLVLPEHF